MLRTNWDVPRSEYHNHIDGLVQEKRNSIAGASNAEICFLWY